MQNRSRARASKTRRRSAVHRRWRGGLARALKTNGLGVAALSGVTVLACVFALAQRHAANPVTLPQRDAAGRPPSAAAVEQAMRRVADEARAAPADSGPLLRRAYLESLGGKPFKAAAVRRSYALEPLGPDATAWRLRFVFEHWSDAPPDVRESALDELAAAFPRHGWAMRGLPDTIHDPTGRMAASLSFARLRATQAADHSTR